MQNAWADSVKRGTGVDQRAEFDEELEEAWPEEDGLPQNAAEYQRQESVRHLRKENETLRRELKAAQRIQLAALALLLIGVVCAYLAGHYFGRKDGISSGYDAGFYNGQQQTDVPAAVQTEPETESARPAMSEARTAASTPARSDGAFIGNSKSKTYHRADCSFLPKESNRVYFTTAAEAEQNGYQPCGHCDPSD